MPEEYLDTRKVQFPRKDGGTGQNTGVTTPKRPPPITAPVFLNLTSSRPTSPKADAENDLVNGNSVMAAAIQKKMNRKRKVSVFKVVSLKQGNNARADLTLFHFL